MPPAPRKTRIKVGVIGLGIIGSRVAANLRGAGHQVYVWSRSPHRAPNFLGSVVEVADLSDVIQVFVSDDAALLDVTRTIAAALSPRHVFACHATVSPDAARRAASIIEGQGARYLDAPFTGSKTAAQNRQLVYYVGGGAEALEEIRPVLEATSKKILHVGGIGDASVLKIATNLLTASTVQTLAEALALVRAAGIPGQKLAEALEYNASRSGTSDLKLPAMIAQNFEPNFSLRHMLKDARLAVNMADALNLSLPVSETTAEVLSLGMENGWADQDFCAIAQLYPLPADEESAPSDSHEEQGSGTPGVSDAAAPAPASPTPATDHPAGPASVKPAAGQSAAAFGAGALRALQGLFKPPTGKAKLSRKATVAKTATDQPTADGIQPTTSEGTSSGTDAETLRQDAASLPKSGETTPQPAPVPVATESPTVEPDTAPASATDR